MCTRMYNMYNTVPDRQGSTLISNSVSTTATEQLRFLDNTNGRSAPQHPLGVQARSSRVFQIAWGCLRLLVTVQRLGMAKMCIRTLHTVQYWTRRCYTMITSGAGTAFYTSVYGRAPRTFPFPSSDHSQMLTPTGLRRQQGRHVSPHMWPVARSEPCLSQAPDRGHPR
jgi:hypothetical protein